MSLCSSSCLVLSLTFDRRRRRRCRCQSRRCLALIREKGGIRNFDFGAVTTTAILFYQQSRSSLIVGEERIG